jgi:hypothetical protein
LVVTHVLLSMTLYHDSKGETLSEILTMNPTIFELVLRDYSSSPSTFRVDIPSEMRPQRLTLNSFDFNVNFAEPLFSSVTHLTSLISTDINRERWERWSRLRAFPALTHLCFTANISGIILLQLLEECSGLRAVVTTWLTRAECRARVNAFSYVLTRPDPRPVVTDVPYFYEGWERGAWSGDDLWARVDDFLARKRRGEIEGIHLF